MVFSQKVLQLLRQEPQSWLRALGPCVSEERMLRFLQNLRNHHNVSACLRTVEGIGLQTVYIIDCERKTRLNHGISKGCERWLDICHFKSSREAVARLHQQGYAVFASALNADSVSLQAAVTSIPSGCRDYAAESTLPKVALVFGNEDDGISSEILGASDGCFKLPMTGFSQSYNVSVACAMSLGVLQAQGYLAPSLTPDEKMDILRRWLTEDVRGAAHILDRISSVEST